VSEDNFFILIGIIINIVIRWTGTTTTSTDDDDYGGKNDDKRSQQQRTILIILLPFGTGKLQLR